MTHPAPESASIAAGKQRIAFWITLIVAKLLVLFPFYGPQLLA